MRSKKKFLVFFLVTIALISTVKLCGGGGDVHALTSIPLYNLK